MYVYIFICIYTCSLYIYIYLSISKSISISIFKGGMNLYLPAVLRYTKSFHQFEQRFFLQVQHQLPQQTATQGLTAGV